MCAAADKGLSAWSLSAEATLESLSVDARRGLDGAEVVKRQRAWGTNRLETTRRRHSLTILWSQFKSIVVVLLLVAGALAVLFTEYAEGLAIFAVILVNTAIGFVTEWRAVRSMEALRTFARVECVVLRDSTVTQVAAETLVPGDIVILEAGDLVPADLRLIEAAKLTADESMLTGESLPVNKQTAILSEDKVLLDRNNMAHKGTCITRGAGKGVVVATGKRTEFGKIFEQVATAKPQQTPLEQRLNALGAGLVWAIIGIAIVIGIAGILAGRDLYLAIEVAIALSVAAIPEGLVIVATIALARGMWRLAKRNALITRLSAVETLGATSVILTDKTGTLTENRMAVSVVLLQGCDVDADGTEDPEAGSFRVNGAAPDADQSRLLDNLFTTATLCNNASLTRGADGIAECVGDPTELALLVAASARDIWRRTLLTQAPEIHEDPFDPDSKRMATVHQQPGGVLVAVKGAPETILPACVAVRSHDGDIPMTGALREQWLLRAEGIGTNGLRTIAIAEKTGRSSTAEPYDGLVLLGIVGMQDPARDGVDRAIALCHRAAISVVMVTGDHAATARNIATEVGIVAASAGPECFVDGTDVDRFFADGRHEELLAARVFSRVTPQQKLELIDLYQRNGHIVAMTGDGVNDAPALKKADIGIAMGVRGTAVAKEAAVMILQDDEFSTIVAAVAHGRAIFDNIRKFVVYLLSCNTSEILVVSLATIIGGPLPLLPLQILFLNLVTDVFPALALGVGEGSRLSMGRKPRPAEENVLTRELWMRVALHGAVMAVAVLAAMGASVYFLNFDQKQAVTVAFCTIAFAQMWHVFNMRDELKQLFNNEISRNAWIWVALIICLLLVLAAVYLEALSAVLRLVDPGILGWSLILPASLVPLAAAPLVSALVRMIRSR